MPRNEIAVIEKRKLPYQSGLQPVAEYVRMSTDYQKYSIEFQCAAIRTFAVQNNMTVIRTYLDHGKSGLTIKGRLGMQSLLWDVTHDRADYKAVLVYDVERWGRFQDIDEAAYFEQICKRAGVRVIFCAEEFDDTPMGGVLKSLRRVMAGEYSRALSARIWGGQVQNVLAGYKVCGPTGYGLRRLLVDFQGNPKGILKLSERKSVQSDRVILIPGPREEVEVVWNIFDWYVLDHKSFDDIVERLNATNTSDQLPWTRARVRNILKGAKYAGDNLYNVRSAKLKSKRKRNPKELWVRKEKAFRGLVTKERFELVQKLIKTPRIYSDRHLQARLRELLEKHGYLSATLIHDEADMPTVQTYVNRYGSLHSAYAIVGYCPLNNHNLKVWHTDLRARRTRTAEQLIAALNTLDISSKWNEPRALLQVSNRLSVSVTVHRYYLHLHHGHPVWTIVRAKRSVADYYFLARLKSTNDSVLDYAFVDPKTMESFPDRISINTFAMRQVPSSDFATAFNSLVKAIKKTPRSKERQADPHASNTSRNSEVFVHSN